MRPEICIFIVLFGTFSEPAQGFRIGRDLAADVETAKLSVVETRDATQLYLDMMNDIEDILWTRVQPSVSIIQENLALVEIGFVDLENIQIQINQASSVLVYQAKLQGKQLVKHLRHLNATEINLYSGAYADLTENRQNLDAQLVQINSVYGTAMELSANEVTLFNEMIAAILEGQSGVPVDNINSSMNDINMEMTTLGQDIDQLRSAVESQSITLIADLDVIIAQIP